MNFDRENDTCINVDKRDGNDDFQYEGNELNDDDQNFHQTENDDDYISETDDSVYKSVNNLRSSNDNGNERENENEVGGNVIPTSDGQVSYQDETKLVNVSNNSQTDCGNVKAFKCGNKGWKNKNNNNNPRNRNNNNNKNNKNNNNNNNNKKDNWNNWSKKNFENANNNTSNNPNNNNSNNNNNKNFTYCGAIMNTATFFPNDNTKNQNNNNNNKKGGSNINNFITGITMARHEIIKKIFKGTLDYLGLKKIAHDPFDSFVLQLHYRFGFAFFFLAFVMVWCNTFAREQIHCTGVDAKKSISFIENLCLSYSHYVMPDKSEKPILFYRWAHFAFLIVCGGMLLLKLPARRFANHRVRNLFFHLTKNATRIDAVGKENGKKDIVNYFKENLGTHFSFYYTFLFNHVIAVIVSLISFWFLDFVLQGEFLKLPLATYPFVRDPTTFRDPLSLIFPPFVRCIIGSGSNMLSKREEDIPCHLTLMELHEKVFICAWGILVGIIMIGFGSVTVLAALPFAKRFLLRTSRKKFTVKETSEYLAKVLNIGDVFLLHLVKNLVSEKQFSEALFEIEGYVKHLQKVKIV